MWALERTRDIVRFVPNRMEGGWECGERNSFSSQTPSVLVRGPGGRSGEWESSLLILHVPADPQVSLGGNRCMGTVSPHSPAGMSSWA